jgi:hypothetical protein
MAQFTRAVALLALPVLPREPFLNKASLAISVHALREALPDLGLASFVELGEELVRVGPDSQVRASDSCCCLT